LNRISRFILQAAMSTIKTFLTVFSLSFNLLLAEESGSLLQTKSKSTDLQSGCPGLPQDCLYNKNARVGGHCKDCCSRRKPCKFGIEKFRKGGCPKCRKHPPCAGVSCLPGHTPEEDKPSHGVAVCRCEKLPCTAVVCGDDEYEVKVPHGCPICKKNHCVQRLWLNAEMMSTRWTFPTNAQAVKNAQRLIAPKITVRMAAKLSRNRMVARISAVSVAQSVHMAPMVRTALGAQTASAKVSLSPGARPANLVAKTAGCRKCAPAHLGPVVVASPIVAVQLQSRCSWMQKRAFVGRWRSVKSLCVQRSFAEMMSTK